MCSQVFVFFSGCVLLRPFCPQVLVSSEVLLLTPRLLGRLELRIWDIPGPGVPAGPGKSAEQAQQRLQRQQRAADLVGRLGAQLAQCSGLQELSIEGLPWQMSVDAAAAALVLAPRLQRLQRLTVDALADSQARSAESEASAGLALTAALAVRHSSRPDAAAARALHVTTDLLSKQGAEEVMRALGRVGVQGVRVEARLSSTVVPA